MRDARALQDGPDPASGLASRSATGVEIPGVEDDGLFANGMARCAARGGYARRAGDWANSY
jgi:hypothetical protein